MKDYVQELLHPLTNVEEITCLLLEELGVKVSRTTISRQLLSHPSFPSMLSVCETLDTYNIKYVCLNTKDVRLFEDYEKEYPLLINYSFIGNSLYSFRSERFFQLRSLRA